VPRDPSLRSGRHPHEETPRLTPRGDKKNKARGDKKGLGETKRGLGVIWEKGVARHNWHKI
jgi:hypothetical protein